MFENFKFAIYSNKLIGYAYNFCDNPVSGIDYTIYLVVLEDKKYNFVKLSQVTVYNNEEMNELVECFNKYNILFITCWLDTFFKDDNVIVSVESRKKVLNLVKNIPRERKDV